jgi:hypothetical protein
MVLSDTWRKSATCFFVMGGWMGGVVLTCVCMGNSVYVKNVSDPWQACPGRSSADMEYIAGQARQV